MSFMEDHPKWYGTYSDYYPEEIIKQTEAEIKEDFEWAWQFAEEVKE